MALNTENIEKLTTWIEADGWENGFSLCVTAHCPDEISAVWGSERFDTIEKARAAVTEAREWIRSEVGPEDIMVTEPGDSSHLAENEVEIIEDIRVIPAMTFTTAMDRLVELGHDLDDVRSVRDQMIDAGLEIDREHQPLGGTNDDLRITPGEFDVMDEQLSEATLVAADD